MLLLGGTGIIGTAVAQLAVEKGFDVTVSGIKPGQVKYTTFVHANDVFEEPGTWDLVFDICSFGRSAAEKTYVAFRARTSKFVLMSSTLVYDRTNISYKPITSTHKRADFGTQGGYVDAKLSLESFWESVTDVPWTIIRPYHILGKGSYLGCLPPHNRDPCLLKAISSGSISLCDGGRIPLNVVNPRDIGEVVLRMLQTTKTDFQKYTVVNPEEITARDYYRAIADNLGVSLNIKSLLGEKVWDSKEWVLTTLPHLYDVSDLKKDIGFVPCISFEKSLKEAMSVQLPVTSKRDLSVYERMHKSPLALKNKFF